MLRGRLGDEAFFEGIRRFYSIYKGGNAVSDDFRKVMESVSGTELAGFFNQWLHQPGWPEYRLAWRWRQENRELEVSIHQTQSATLFDMPVEIAITVEGSSEAIRHKLILTDAARTIRIPVGRKPLSVELDPDGWVLKSVSVSAAPW
jgi:aminopeptidase N